MSEQFDEMLELCFLMTAIHECGGGAVWLSTYRISRSTINHYVLNGKLIYEQNNSAVRAGEKFYTETYYEGV